MTTRLRLKQIAQDGATDGQVIAWDDTAGKWAPATPSGGGGDGTPPEAWHEVGASGEPPFENGWANLGLGYDTAAYYKDAGDVVHLKGTVAGGTSDARVFTLPSGYRPAARKIFATIAGSNTSASRIDVTAAGEILTVQAAGNGFLTLDGITFRVP